MKLKKSWRFWCSALSIAIFMGALCCAISGNRPDSSMSQVGLIQAEIEAMPDWLSLPDSCRSGGIMRWFLARREMRQQRTIEQSIESIAGHSLDNIRAAMERYRTTSRDSELMVDARLMLLTKYLFSLPENVRRDSPLFQYVTSGWYSQPGSNDGWNPRDSDEISALWPWSKDTKGELHLSGRVTDGWIGIYAGPRIDVLRRFDYLRQTLGRRRAECEKPGTGP